MLGWLSWSVYAPHDSSYGWASPQVSWVLHFEKKVPVHRLTTFRIAALVAEALCFLHNNGIIFHDLKAANVLLWILDPASLCRCKLTDFTITPHFEPKSSVLGLSRIKGHDSRTCTL